MTLVWRPGYGGAAVSDPDAQAYLQAVEVADNQALEQGVQQAVNQFVIGCKNDGIWDAIKACCILAGARTLSGALVPLVGTAPTNNNFVSGDYNRETGLQGDASTKYLDSNRNNNADPQNNQHFYTVVTSTPTGTMATMGAGGTDNGSSNMIFFNSTAVYRSRNGSSLSGVSATTHSIGGFGASRTSSTDVSYLSDVNLVSTATDLSQSPYAGNIHIFRRNAATTVISNARLSFYSIGESLDLALLDTRVSNLMTAIGAAIP